MNHLEPPFSSNRPIGNVLRAEIERLDAVIEDRDIECRRRFDSGTALKAEISRLNAALDEITDYVPATIDDNGGNPKVSLFCVHKLQAIARAARSNQKESN
jgi:uncharacterized small protein (DUF1192 family)